MPDYYPLSEISDRHIIDSLTADRLSMHLGPFVIGLQARYNQHSIKTHILPHLRRCYKTVNFSTQAGVLTDSQVSLRAPNILRQFIRPQIIPDPGFEFPALPLPLHMAPLALEMGLNLTIALQMFRFLIIHGGVVAGDDGGIIISAESGGGKSSLTAALMQQGYRLLSDEFTIIDPETCELVAYPRPVSLKNESIDAVKSFAGEHTISPVLTNTPKGSIAYRYARPSDIDQHQIRAKPKLIIFPTFKSKALPKAKLVESADAIVRLIPSSTNYQALGEAGYKVMMHLGTHIKAYEITYGSTEASLQLIHDILAGQIE